MIEFSCIYCGQPVRVAEELARKQIDCPGCGHTIRVRPAERGQALRPAADSGVEAARKSAEYWNRLNNDEIREAVLVPAMSDFDRRTHLLKRSFAPWLPRYDDLSLFAFSLAAVMLLAVDADLRQSLVHLMSREWTNPLAAWLLLVACGGLLSLVNVLLGRERSEFERTMMLFFAVLVTVVTGFSAGRPMLSGGWTLLAIFPLWNIANGLLLLILVPLGVVDHDCLTGEKAGFRQVLLATVSITLLILACHYLFKRAPLTTFSIAVVYTMSLHNVIRRLLARKQRSANAGGRVHGS